MPFIALEGFSGTGKTSLATGLERQGWLRLQESAHAVPKDVPVADRADTPADFSLLGATMVYSSIISKLRGTRNIVSEGYLLSDLAYAKIRFELKKSEAYPAMLTICRRILQEPAMKPDLYILLKAGAETIDLRQRDKDERERNMTEFFRTRYYSALAEIHDELGEKKSEVVETDSDLDVTLQRILDVIRRRKVVSG
ncbi:MAG: AAA family ATPase [Thaumarchaeota archaeon]|nr:AAA family ATPase [Nitrososphaerota archaeon]